MWLQAKQERKEDADASGGGLEFDFTLPLFDRAQIPAIAAQDEWRQPADLSASSKEELQRLQERAGRDYVVDDDDEEDSDDGDESWKNDATAWLSRARAKTAKSSRKSREKRRREEDTIYEENKR